MANPVDSKQGGVQDAPGTSAVSKISANYSVKASSGPIGIMTDIPQFAGATVTGVWTMGTLRAKIRGIPVITTMAIGVGVASAMPPPTTGPLRLGQSDSKVKAM